MAQQPGKEKTPGQIICEKELQEDLKAIKNVRKEELEKV